MNMTNPQAGMGIQYIQSVECVYDTGFQAAIAQFIPIGVINENHEIIMAPRRKTWLSERDDKAWRQFWDTNSVYERVYARAP